MCTTTFGAAVTAIHVIFIVAVTVAVAVAVAVAADATTAADDDADEYVNVYYEFAPTAQFLLHYS